MILLLLTDGSVDDIRPTLKELMGSADLPLSVIFVGIGENDFSGMKDLLEGDKESR